MLVDSSSPNGRSLVNVNFPDVSTLSKNVDDVVFKWCELDPNPLPTQFLSTDEGYVYSGIYRERAREAGCDIDQCFTGDVAITELH